jgi:hypothetical protein
MEKRTDSDFKKTWIRAIRDSWGEDTAYPPSYDVKKRCSGQCAVTAAVVWEHLGGVIVRCAHVLSGGGVDSGSHYFNIISDGSLIDITKSQFTRNVRYEGLEISNLDRIIGNPDTQKRLNLLRYRAEKRFRFLWDRPWKK